MTELTEVVTVLATVVGSAVSAGLAASRSSRRTLNGTAESVRRIEQNQAEDRKSHAKLVTQVENLQSSVADVRVDIAHLQERVPSTPVRRRRSA